MWTSSGIARATSMNPPQSTRPARRRDEGWQRRAEQGRERHRHGRQDDREARARPRASGGTRGSGRVGQSRSATAVGLGPSPPACPGRATCRSRRLRTVPRQPDREEEEHEDDVALQPWRVELEVLLRLKKTSWSATSDSTTVEQDLQERVGEAGRATRNASGATTRTMRTRCDIPSTRAASESCRHREVGGPDHFGLVGRAWSASTMPASRGRGGCRRKRKGVEDDKDVQRAAASSG